MIEAYFTKQIPADCISANRLGQWSEEQKEQVISNTNMRFWLTGSAILSVLIALFYVILKTFGASPGNLLVMVGLLGVCLLFAGMRALGLFLLRRRLLSDSFTSCDGRIVFQHYFGLTEGGPGKNYYPFDDSGKILKRRSFFGMSWNLPPGRYRFYSLSKDGLLFSAEPLSSYAVYERDLLDTIAESFHFTLAELENYRVLAQSGEILTSDGEYMEVYFSDDIDMTTDRAFEMRVGALKFTHQNQETTCLLRGLIYRAYYKVGESDSILDSRQESRLKLLAIEPIGVK
jgi:hypothetical protein